MKLSLIFFGIALAPLSGAQSAKDFRDLIKEGSEAIPKLEGYLKDPAPEVRAEAAKAIASIGTQRSLSPLTAALEDSDPEVQIRATDGLVSFYLPEYAKDSLSTTVKRSDKGVTGRFPDTDNLIIEPYLQVRPEITAKLRSLLKSGGDPLVAANVARALGALRVSAAVPELVDSLRTKNDQVLYQSLMAIQKIGAREAAPRITFLTRDLDERVQIAAIETVGILGNRGALPDLKRVLDNNPKTKVRRAVLTAMAMLPDPSYRDFYAALLNDKDENARGAGAEGLGRLGNSQDRSLLEAAWADEKKTSALLSLAFGLVALGHTETGEGSPLDYLVKNLDSRSWRGVAQPLLAELARQRDVRRSLIPLMDSGKSAQRAGVISVLGTAGASEAASTLERLARDPDPQVADAAVRALRSIRAAGAVKQ